MKKGLAILVCVLLLTGCGVQDTFETLSDDDAVSAMATAAKVELLLPEEAASPSMESEDGGKLYLCDGYTVTVQTLSGGDVGRTVQEVSGYAKEELTVMQTKKNDLTCYEMAWCAAGEGEDQVCRCVILDDGAYHYAVTVMANYSRAGALQETWQSILDSVTLSIG